MSKHKKKKIRIDEYYNDGLFEIQRFGNVTSIQNKMSKSEMDLVHSSMKEQYAKTVQEINDIITELCSLITREDPLRLLKFCQHSFLMSNLGIASEHQLSSNQIYTARMTEYVQSVLVSSESHYIKNNDDPSEDFFHIASLVEELYSAIHQYYLVWALYKRNDSSWDKTIDWIVESLLAFNVRGNRYQVVEEEFHRSLISPHNETLISIYGVTAEEVINGLLQLLYNLSQGQFDPLNSVMNIMDSCGIENCDNKVVMESLQGIFGYDLNDVIKATGWPEPFVQDLSYSICSVKDFIDKENVYSGWPLLNLPIHRKPFIAIDGNYYCFDYYSLSDNFYRAVQRAVNSHINVDVWKEEQKLASEECVEIIFQKILPDSQIYRDNYYPINNTLKRMAENDLLVIYENNIIVIEVKAGSFVYTSPFMDFDSHIISYKNLIEKADHQCERVCHYIEKSCTSDIIFYDDKKREKIKLNTNEIEKVFKISVTVDNINSFAARAEKLGFLNLKSKAICLGLDDLITYSEYFDSPLIFMHYLRQRESATQNPNLQLFDELDHLGMYIEYNCYPMIVNQLEKDSHVFFDGFRENLDIYFGQKYHSSLNPKKPVQNIPKRLRELISCIYSSDIGNKVWLSSYLLDFDHEARIGLCDSITAVIEKQRVNHKMTPIICAGGKESLRYCLFVSQPGIEEFSEKEKEEYTLSVLLHNEEHDRVRIDIEVDEAGTIVAIIGKAYKQESIPVERASDLMSLGKKNAGIRVLLYKQKHGKIGRNDYCPCGSGKKYKKCCGRS